MSDVQKQLGRIEMKLEDHERRLRLQEEKNDYLNEISTSIKLQVEHSKMQDEKINKLGEQFVQITKVLDGINTNLLSLNHDVKEVKNRQEKIDNKVERLEEERIEQLKKIEKEREDELKQAQKERRDFVLKIVSGVLITVLGTALLLWFGLK